MNILQWARKVQAIAQNGLEFTKDPFDRERFEQLQQLVATILSSEVGISSGQLQGLWVGDEGYATPKVDVRGAVFDQDKVLLVRERSDGGWTFPGGWVDVGDSPASAVEREIREESGYLAKAIKLAALYDKNNP
ncbi:MAG: NUDIX hydrolase N-terminal domain-containing protein, partial [Sinobacteraceae bacterium]|nr:NUDIX hydrolase N-terminal domain-containing protein [Nevskiaceae bacterium]